MKVRTWVVSSLLISAGLPGCGSAPQVRVAVDVDNRSTDAGQPDSARIRLYCDGIVVVDTILGNEHSGPPYRTGNDFNRHWLLVTPGQHRLRVEAPKHNLTLDTLLALDTLSFTSINLHHHIRIADTIRFPDGSQPHIIPGDTTNKIMLSKVPFEKVPLGRRPQP